MGQAEVTAGEGIPGTVLGRGPDHLDVACKSGAVRLSGLSCLKGLPIDTGRAGATLASPSDAEAAALDAALAPVAVAEPRMRALLLKPDPVLTASGSSRPDWQRIDLRAAGAASGWPSRHCAPWVGPVATSP